MKSRHIVAAAKRAISIVALVVCGYLLTLQPAFGQGYGCGTGMGGWISDTISMPVRLSCPDGMHFVTVLVHYCYPAPGGPVLPKEQFIIRAISGLGDSCTILPADMRDLGLNLIKANPKNFSCGMPCNPWCTLHPDSCCPSRYPQWKASWASCFRTQEVWDSTEQNTKWVSTSCEVQGICYDAYHVCCGSGNTPVVAYLAGSVYTEQCETGGLPPFGCYPVCGSPGPGPYHQLCDSNLLKMMPYREGMLNQDTMGPSIPDANEPSGNLDLTLHRKENE